jgi:hypothetical protein
MGRDRGEKCPFCLGEENNINIFLLPRKAEMKGKILWRNVVGVEERETLKKILGSAKLSF